MVAALSSADVSGMALGDNLNPLVTAVQIGNNQVAAVAQTIANYFPSQGALSTSLRITSTIASTSTLVIAGAGYLIAVSVVRASSGTDTGLIYDSATTAISSFTGAMVVIPASVGFYNYPMPFNSGLVVAPSTASGTQIVSVTYRHVEPGAQI
jgi:hypothetical protein